MAGKNGYRILGAAEILAAPDMEDEIVATPEWGEGTAVRVQSMNAAQRMAYWGFVLERQPDGTRIARDDVVFSAALAVCSIVDEDGQPLFTLAQVEALAQKHPAPLDRISAVARRLSGLDTEAASERLKAIPSSVSPSASPGS